MKLRSSQPPELNNGKSERYKLLYDFLKHLTTLSSGSILIILALAEKFFRESPLSTQLFWSLACFLATILGALIAMMVLAANVDRKTTGEGAKNWFATAFTSAATTYVAGMIFIVIAVMGQYG